MLNLRFCLIVGDLGEVDSKHSIGEHHVMSCSLLVFKQVRNDCVPRWAEPQRHVIVGLYVCVCVCACVYDRSKNFNKQQKARCGNLQYSCSTKNYHLRFFDVRLGL